MSILFLSSPPTSRYLSPPSPPSLSFSSFSSFSSSPPFPFSLSLVLLVVLVLLLLFILLLVLPLLPLSLLLLPVYVNTPKCVSITSRCASSKRAMEYYTSFAKTNKEVYNISDFSEQISMFTAITVLIGFGIIEKLVSRSGRKGSELHIPLSLSPSPTPSWRRPCTQYFLLDTKALSFSLFIVSFSHMLCVQRGANGASFE